jgi:6-phosphogluconolactonase
VGGEQTVGVAVRPMVRIKRCRDDLRQCWKAFGVRGAHVWAVGEMRMAFYRRVLGIALLGSASVLSSSMLAGCGSFFSCEGKTSCGGGTTTVTNTGDFVYVSNPSNVTDISGYTITSGALAAISGADIDLGYVPIAMVVAPSNGFLYVASRADAPSPGPGVYVYAISSTGALTLGNNGNPFSTDDGISSIDISPDGNYLYTVGTPSTSGLTNLTEYQLNTTTGLTIASTIYFTPLTTCAIDVNAIPLSQQCTVKVSPNGNYVGVALGSYGFEVFPYSSTLGVTNTPQLSPSTKYAAFSLAFDTNNYLYVASTSTDSTSALTSYGGLGATAAVQEDQATYASGVKPRSVTVSGTSYVYTANESTGKISGFSLPGSGKLTSLGTPTTGPSNVSALGVDSTGKYLVAAGFSATNGLQVFNITSTGALTSAGTPTGTGVYSTIPIVMALSH